MKRFISLVLTLIIIGSVFTGFEVSAKSNKYSVYNDAIFDVQIRSTEEDYSYLGTGSFLYDFNKDSVKELVYCSLNDYGDFFVGVYTIRNQKARRLLRKEIGNYAGNGMAKIGVATKNGNDYLYVVYTNNSWIYEHDKIYVYKVTKNGTKLVTKVSQNYCVVPERDERNYKPNARINGKKVQWSKLNKWISSFKFKIIKKKVFKIDSFSVYLYDYKKSAIKSLSKMKSSL